MSHYRRTLRIAGWILATVVLCLFVITGLSYLMQKKESLRRYADFFDLADQIDVLFLGSSHVLNGINPAQLYAQYGITSYNMAKHGGMVTESYWQLMNALDYCQPKCVVVDLWALDRDYQHIDIMNGTEEPHIIDNSVALLHDNMDCWPLTGTKMNAVCDLLSTQDRRIEFLWDYSLYHSRWNELGETDFRALNQVQNRYRRLGAVELPAVELNPELNLPDDLTQTIENETVCMTYLKKIVETCKDRGIVPIMMFVPMGEMKPQDIQAINTGKRIARETGCVFLDPVIEDKVVDLTTDLSDNTHLNTLGMFKLTAYVGKALHEKTDMTDHRNDPLYTGWNDHVNRWIQDVEESIESPNSIYTQLGDLFCMDKSCIIYIREKSNALNDPVIQNMVMLLSGRQGIMTAAESATSYIVCRSGGSYTSEEGASEITGASEGGIIASAIGPMVYVSQNGFAGLYPDADLEENTLDMDEHFRDDVQVLVLSRDGKTYQRYCYKMTME